MKNEGFLDGLAKFFGLCFSVFCLGVLKHCDDILKSMRPAIKHGLSSSDSAAIHGLSSIDSAKHGLSSIDSAKHGLSSIDSAKHGLSSIDSAKHGLSSIDSAAKHGLSSAFDQLLDKAPTISHEITVPLTISREEDEWAKQSLKSKHQIGFIAIVPRGDAIPKVFGDDSSYKTSSFIKQLHSVESKLPKVGAIGLHDIKHDRTTLDLAFQNATENLIILTGHSPEEGKLALPSGEFLLFADIHEMAIKHGRICLILTCNKNDFYVNREIRFDHVLECFADLKGRKLTSDQTIQLTRHSLANLQIREYVICGVQVSAAGGVVAVTMVATASPPSLSDFFTNLKTLIGGVQSTPNDLKDIVASWGRNLAKCQTAAKDDPGNAQAQRNLAMGHVRYAQALYNAGHIERAVKALHDCHAVLHTNKNRAMLDDRTEKLLNALDKEFGSK